MPSKTRMKFEIEDIKIPTFQKAAAMAVNLSIEREDSVTIVQYDPDTEETLYITVTAQSGTD